MSCLSKANLQITVGGGSARVQRASFKKLLHILRCQHANFPAAESAWRKQRGTKGEQKEARDVRFGCDQWCRENRFVI